MKLKGKRIAALLLSIIFTLLMGVTAYAAELPDVNKECSITFTMLYGGTTPVSGGSLTIYRVGEIAEDDGNYSFKPTGAFEDCSESFANLGDTALATRLEAYAQQHSIAGMTKRINAEGIVVFDELPVGLYLVVQQEAASGYEKIAPFLISLPYFEDGAYQ